ncbi:MAG: TonB-dependent receptor [Alphaproteobacteria bacterium]|nr:TonB-dependent receptor [Alphaproteobacteria bacterium]
MQFIKRRSAASAALAGASVAALALFSTTVAAQAQTSTKAAAKAAASDTIETVTVTATRRAEDQEKVAVALTAVTKDQLNQLAPHTLQDLTGIAPNVFIGMGTAGPAQSAIFIRGQGYADVEKTQSPPVGVMQDGVFFGNNTGQLLDMFDVCSVEIDRGPQGIFYGKNTTAGLINIKRCAPTREWGAQLSAGYGSYNDEYVRGIFNAPLGDRGGVKFTAQWHGNDGYYKNDYTGKNAGGSRYIALHGVIDYDLTSWLNVNFSYDHMHMNGGGEPVQFGDVLTANILSGGNPKLVWPNYNPVTGSPDGLAPWHIENRPGGDTDRYDNDIYSLTFRAGLGKIGKLVSQTAYMDEADDVLQAFDGTCYVGIATPGPGCTSVGNPLLASVGSYLETGRYQTYKQFTQETRLQGSWNQFDYIVGVYFYRHIIDLHQNSDALINQYSSEGDYSWSYFGNLDWNVTDTIQLSAGLREIDETAAFSTSYYAGPFPLITPIHQRKSWSKLITRFNAQWQVTPRTMIYANRAEGFRSGGFSMRGTLSEQSGTQTNCGIPTGCPGNNFLTFAPESNVTYEVGAKNRFFANSLVFNIDGFINDITDMQQAQVVETPGYGPGTNTYIVSYPKVQIKGIEMSFDADVGSWIEELAGLQLSGSVGLQGANVENGIVNGQEVALGAGATAGAPGSIANFTGSTLQRVPSTSYGVTATYTHPIGDDKVLTLSTDYSWMSKFSLGNFGTAQDYQPGYGLLNASATVNWGNYYIRFSGKNLTNEAYRDQSLPTVFFQGWGPPQTFGVEIGAKF